MTAGGLLAQIKQSGCQVVLDGDNLKVRGPLTDELRQAIRDNKPALVALLQSDPPRPVKACCTCHGKRWWRLQQGTVWICERCHPPVWKDVVTVEVEVDQ